MTVYPKGSEVHVSKDFKVREMDCKCSHPTCIETHIDDNLIIMLQGIRDAVGATIHITSGNRCSAHQQELKEKGLETAPGRSPHEDFIAADISTGFHTGEELELIARNVGFQCVGVGKNWIHCDLRPGPKRWIYSY